jgi:MFS family permease
VRPASIAASASGSPPDGAAAVRRAAWLLVATAVLAQVSVSVVEMGVPTLAPFLKESFGLSVAGVGLLVACVNGGRVLGSWPAGLLADRIGEPPVMLAACAGVSAFVSLSALAAGPLGAGAAFACLGVFAGAAAPAGSRFVLSAFGRRRRGLPMGLRQSAVPLGGLIAAFALPFLADRWGLPVALLAAGGTCLVGGVLVALLARHAAGTLLPRRATGTQHPRHAVGTPLAACPRAARSARAPRPTVRDGNVRLVIAWGVLFIGGQYALVSYLVLDLVRTGGLTLASASSMLVVAQLGGIVGRIAWGVLSDLRFAGRRRPPLLVLNAVACATAFSLAALGRSEPLSLIAVTSFLAGATMIGWQGVWMSLISELYPPAMMGRALGYGLTFTNVAIVAWPPAFGLIADRTGGFAASWAVLGGALCVSVLLMSFVHESPAGERQGVEVATEPVAESAGCETRAPWMECCRESR